MDRTYGGDFPVATTGAPTRIPTFSSRGAPASEAAMTGPA